MKSLNFIIIATIICIFAVSSCNKDENIGNLNNPKISQEDLDVAQKITSFIEKINNPSMLKSGEVISVDEAFWNLEAAMNYSFANVPESFVDIVVDSVKFTIPISGGYCSENDLAELYQLLHAATQEASNTDEGQLMGIAVTASDQSDDSVTVMGTFIISLPYPEYFEEPINFLDYDYWYIGFDRKFQRVGGGLAPPSPYAGQLQHRCAATELQRKINIGMGIYNGNVYYTDFSFHSYISHSYVSSEVVLSPTLLNNLLSVGRYMLNIHKPVNKVTLPVEWIWDVKTESDDYGYSTYGDLRATFSYAIPHTKPLDI